MFQDPISVEDLTGNVADGMGVEQKRGTKGELQAVIGNTEAGRVEPLGCFTNTDWPEVERTVKDRLWEAESYKIPFIYGEPRLDDFLANLAEAQRCMWHGPWGLYNAVWEDGVKKKESQPETDKVKQLIAIELPEGDYELLREEDKEAVKCRCESSKEKI